MFKLATTEVKDGLSPLVGKARGRGRGRGTVSSPPKVGANGAFQVLFTCILSYAVVSIVAVAEFSRCSCTANKRDGARTRERRDFAGS